MNNFKKQITQQRTAIPQVDPESSRPIAVEPFKPVEPEIIQEPSQQAPKPQPVSIPPETKPQPPRLTIVDTSESPVNRGFYMYPSRHEQVVRDLVYAEKRKPWQIIEDALEEYVVRHYGKEYKRK